MGVFRLVLAATVMLGHFAAFYPHHLPYLLLGDASVPAFYIVSGFLITLVLHERYRERVLLFYSNRILRIFPLYWAALAIFLLVNWLVVRGHLPEAAGTGLPVYHATSALWWADQHGAEVGPLGAALLTLSNVFIVGQDIMLRVGRWPYLLEHDYFYHAFMYVGPAWTIAIELSFYAIAPFVVRRWRWVVGLMVASLIGRFVAIRLGHAEYVVDYTFFPFEIAFFMAGSLAYRAYAWLRAASPGWAATYDLSSCALIALFTVLYLTLDFGRWPYLVAVSLCLPGIVRMGRRATTIDRICGDLSYPIYLLHPLMTIFIVPGSTVLAEIAAIAGILALSFGLVQFVERPLDRFRQQRVSRGARAAALIRALKRG